ncbi:MAG: YcdB/YcdC domain-containing protein [Eubacteriales bacterium]
MKRISLSIIAPLTVLVFLIFFKTGVCAASGGLFTDQQVMYSTVQVSSALAETASSGQKSEPAISQDKALQIAREMFQELLEGKDVDIQLDDSYMGDNSQVWRLSLFDRGEERWSEQFEIGIDADTGSLSSFACFNRTAGLKGSASLLSKEAARQKAEEYAKKYRPAEFSHTRLSGRDYLDYSTGNVMKDAYTFSWERFENGIPVEGDGIHVGVDLFSGRLTNFSVIWHSNAVFPQPGSLPEGLENKVIKEMGLILSYQIIEGAKKSQQSAPEATPVYQLNSMGSLAINPGSGEVYTWDGKTTPLSQYKRFSNLPAPKGDGSSIDGSGPVQQPAQKISQAEAQNAAREFLRKIGIDQEVVRNGSGSGSGSSGNSILVDETWIYSLKDQNNWEPGKQQKNVNVGVDVFTGEVKLYDVFTEYAGDDQSSGDIQKITWDVARNKALDFIRLVSPEKLGQVVEDQSMSRYRIQDDYIFNFVRLFNGIPFLQDTIMICVSAGGEITSYNCNWHAVKFPSVAGLITVEEAEKIFLEKMHLKPCYFYLSSEESTMPGEQPVLALMFDNHREIGIDARSGQLAAIDVTEDQSENKSGVVIPSGHWAAVPLSVLAESGLLPAEGFDPDKPVSRRDAIRILMSASERYYYPDSFQQGGEKAIFTDVSPDDRDYAVIQTAAKRGIMEKSGRFLPDQPVLREDLAVWLVRALGYGEVADMPVKIELKTADANQVSEKARNYVAIAYGLGLIKGDENGLFRPADQATWAELASIVTRAAPRLMSANDDRFY